MSTDPYSYPGTDVLRNKPGIRDADKLSDYEHRKTTIASLVQREQPIHGNFDLAHLQAIHGDLFKDVYEWAGQLRTVSKAKGGSAFAQPDLIESYANSTVFKDLKKENYLKGMGAEKFAGRLAHHAAEINALHPFREGNGRATRQFLEELARQAGYKLDYSGINARTWNDASRDSFHGSLAPLEKIFRENITSIEIGSRGFTSKEIAQSRVEVGKAAADQGLKSLREASVLRRDVAGEVVAVTAHHALVKMPGNVAIVFDSGSLDRQVALGEQVMIRYGEPKSALIDKNHAPSRTDPNKDRAR